MDHSLEDLFEIMRIVSDGSSSCGNASSNASEWCDHYDTCIECRAALIDAIERKIADEYVRLPKGADGEVIHIGDELDDSLSRSFAPKRVKMLMLEDDEWALNFGSGWCSMRNHEWRHHHGPTVEDVLREFADGWSFARRTGHGDGYLASFAAKLRLAGGAE